jgi:hypothetical protein
MSEATSTVEQRQEAPVRTEVSYLPATERFRAEYDGETLLATIRSQAMTFFQVSDHKDRDVHEFFLEFEGQRITDLGQTLEHLVHERRHATFNLVEQITQGAA